MIDSRSISVTLAVAYCLWLATVGLFAIAALVLVSGGGRTAILIAEGACILSAMAATGQIKHYAEGVCRVVRDRDELSADIRRLQARG